MLKKLWADHWFVLLLPVIFIVAWFAPGLAAKGGWLRPEFTTSAAVALIFVFQGWCLPLHAVGAALSQVRLHAVVQGMTFVGFPLLGWAVARVGSGWLSPELLVGVLYLSVLPSTVSSASVLTAAAGGNAAGAICNAVLSSLAGIVLTPLLVSFMLSGSGWLSAAGAANPTMAGAGGLVWALTKLILLPFLFGQTLRLRWGAWATTRKRRIGTWSSVFILFIVFAAFCDARQNGVWTDHGWRLPAQAALVAVVMFWLATRCTRALIRVCRLGQEDALAAEFCAVQKTLASGVPMAGVIFGGDGSTGIILLPLLIYHPLQLAVHGAMATRQTKVKRG